MELRPLRVYVKSVCETIRYIFISPEINRLWDHVPVFQVNEVLQVELSGVLGQIDGVHVLEDDDDDDRWDGREKTEREEKRLYDGAFRCKRKVE